MVGKETRRNDRTDRTAAASLENGEAVRVAAPDIGEGVILLTASQYESIRELLADQREQQAVLRYAMKQAAKVSRENL